MDPNATLKLLNAALTARCFRTARELRADLLNWRKRGGFAPTWSECPVAALYCGVSPTTGDDLPLSHEKRRSTDICGK